MLSSTVMIVYQFRESARTLKRRVHENVNTHNEKVYRIQKKIYLK